MTVLDTVISEVLEGRKRQQLFISSLDQLGEELESDPSGETVESHLLEIETLAEQENPIRRRIRQMQRELPVSFGLHIHPLNNRPGYVGARQLIQGGIELAGQVSRHKVLLSYDVYVRTVNCSGCNAFDLANLLAEYGLARKATRTIGESSDAWQRLQEESPWTEMGRSG